MASSSSAIDSCDNYDVFLSFRGDDTRNNFTSHLYEALCCKKINTFIDYNIKRGKEITQAIERVIEGAKISIIVFSPDYASSTFCLDELVKIMQCEESKQQIVLPIFYKVEPSEKTYQEAFERRIPNFSGRKRCRNETNKQEKVKEWKSAFSKALKLAGWPIDDKCNEAENIKNITSDVLTKLKELNNSQPKGEELMCTSMVGQTVDDNFKKIWECLMNDKISRVGVYGMGGVGKTALATRINDQLLASVNSFSHVFWVIVSKELSICNMQNNIATMIDLDLSKEDDERKRAAKLRKMLKTKKFVLILDDLWEAFEIEDVGIPPLVGGQKLLLTSRSRRVCEIMECQTFEVKPLPKKEALDLFMKESKYQINDSMEWREIVCSIVKECDGLPLAIVVIARRMRGVKEIRNWRNTLRELQKPSEGENPEMEEKVFKVLKFSYDRLSNDVCRQCFLYCSLFPEDYKFERDDLIDYWIGERLIDELDSKQAELDKGNVILDELIHSSLLEDNYMPFKSIKMHDVIRDMARINVKVGLQFQDPLESVQVLNETILKRFSNSAPHCSKLKTLVLQVEKLSDCSFDNMQSLNVLHMTKVTSIQKCIPSLVGLEKLRHLKISLCKLKEIPKGIETLVNLRVLDLSMNVFLFESFPSGVIRNLSHLQTLDLRESRVEVEPEELISLEKLEILRLHFLNLRKLNCYVKSEHWRRLMDYQINYGKYNARNMKKGMSLEAVRDVEEWKGESVIFLPDNIQNLYLFEWKSPMFCFLKNPTFADLQTICISVYKSRYLFTVHLAQKLLHNVQQLHFYSCNGLKEIIAREEEWVNRSNYISYPTILLPNLKMLDLHNLPKLRSIYKGRMVCPSLELILIRDCDKVERLPFCMEKEGNKQNPTIKIGGFFEGDPVTRRWWDSLQWDDPNAKSMYTQNLISESESEHEGESQVDTENESESEHERESEFEHESESESKHEGESEVNQENLGQTSNNTNAIIKQIQQFRSGQITPQLFIFSAKEMTPLKWSLVNLPEITWNTLKSLLFLLKRLCKIYRIQWPNQEICKEETEKQYRGTHHRLMGLSVLNLEC